MAKKAELYEELKKLDKKTKLTAKNTIAEIETAITELKKDVKEVVTDVVEKIEGIEEHYTKSGKRSKKHEDEVKAEQEKEDRKASASETPAEKKNPAPKVRPLIERRGKNYRKVAEKVQKDKIYGLDEAIKLAVETCPAKFDSTVEIHARLGVDPKHADQNIRSTIALPNGTGKTVRVAALVAADNVKSVTEAGADFAGEEAILSKLDKGTVDFDVLIAEPQFMPKLGKYARLLGPKGLMPNLKSGTVSTNPTLAAKESKGGKVEYRVDKQSIVHLGIGKVSFGSDKLAENAKAFFVSLESNKPSTIKGTFILSTYITTTMGPGIKFNI
jgi:ribosomal protein L1, bacterial/chloroplast